MFCVESGRKYVLLANGAITVEVNGDLVAAGTRAQSLERAVEVVDDAGGVTVDEHLRVTRRHLQPYAGERIPVSTRVVRPP